MNEFKVKITGVGKLWDVDFFLEKDPSKSISFNYKAGRKEWFTEKFKYSGGDEFIYELVVMARYGTKWSGQILIYKDGVEEEFLKWSSAKTGKNNESRRTKPTKKIP
ncbi:hypothetical protein BFP97_17915 [Roseivirga sp. 4D4]|uniref:hypothetical protein n=1 Tax=Roseivirga sp. 4D4 TaxID=1889784 RepID=UPI000852E882|nr:hypothetical protein [Roseivirga sp. 4D4]OEK03287.1 hypothetical protein BFP97_17915 [Roseivirga sp. 4D4]